MSDAVAGAFIAGMISLAAALLAAAATIAFTFREDEYRRALATHREYLSWLRGLVPECDLIMTTIDQLQPLYTGILQTGQSGCPTKQLNTDFLAAARLGILKHPRAAALFPTLTNAYRDVVHTNEMMTRYEDMYLGGYQFTEPTR